jgi:predicted tellurium resistance membrane protein TerC
MLWVLFIKKKMNTIFWICVELMVRASKMLGITYQELNVILFVFLHPMITLIIWFKYKKYKREARTKQTKLNATY